MLLGSGSKDHGLLVARIGGREGGEKEKKKEDLPKKISMPK
jgi:hypothetical protein